jgi:hypothetical protein
MKNLKINWKEGEVRHKGFFIPLNQVKKWILGNGYRDVVLQNEVYRSFNKITGEIDRKFAWDTVFFHVHKDYGLKNVFDEILVNENLIQ